MRDFNNQKTFFEKILRNPVVDKATDQKVAEELNQLTSLYLDDKR